MIKMKIKSKREALRIQITGKGEAEQRGVEGEGDERGVLS